MDIKEKLYQEIQELSKNIPIKWDRITISKYLFVAYGWIPRKANNKQLKDFIVYFYFFELKTSFFTTSSVKYSKRFAKNWKTDHSDCIQFKSFFKNQIRKEKQIDNQKIENYFGA